MNYTKNQNVKAVLIAGWLPCLVLIFSVWFTGCNETGLVNNVDDFNNAVKNAAPGDKIFLANGVWKDAEPVFTAYYQYREM